MTREIVRRSRAKIADVREWVIALGVLTSGNMTRADAEMKLRAYVPLLQQEFSPGAFCQASLAAVARECHWFPSYAEVARHLSAWWRANRPPLPTLPAPEPLPERLPPTPEQIAHVERIAAEVVANLRADALYRASQAPEPEVVRPRARHLTPEQLDAINPLPNGRKRV